MKKALILSMLLPLFLSAQIKKGTYTPGIGLSYSSSENSQISVESEQTQYKNTSKSSSVYLSLKYFLFNNIALTGSMNSYQSSSTLKSSSEYRDIKYETESATVTINGGGLIYLGKGKTTFFGGGELGVNMNSFSYIESESSDLSFDILTTLKVGVNYFVTDNIAFVPEIILLKTFGVQMRIFDDSEIEPVNQYELESERMTIQFGIEYFFHR
ncbi:outer membrane beta-barrel protein [bacterium]|nr:outer membrane beta-barrel protein [bacterium]